MKIGSSLPLVPLLATILSTQAHALDVIYKVSGVIDSGGAINTGVATAIHCTNFSGVNARIDVTFKNSAGTGLGGGGGLLGPSQTLTVATRGTNLFNENFPGVAVQQGSAIVQSNSPKVHCSAMIVDAAATVPQGIALHMVRFNPEQGTQE
jgi:hypothetical protein